jgi:hypothetical protein
MAALGFLSASMGIQVRYSLAALLDVCRDGLTLPGYHRQADSIADEHHGRPNNYCKYHILSESRILSGGRSIIKCDAAAKL